VENIINLTVITGLQPYLSDNIYIYTILIAGVIIPFISVKGHNCRVNTVIFHGKNGRHHGITVNCPGLSDMVKLHGLSFVHK